jgi:hypothetical protein
MMFGELIAVLSEKQILHIDSVGEILRYFNIW